MKRMLIHLMAAAEVEVALKAMAAATAVAVATLAAAVIRPGVVMQTIAAASVVDASDLDKEICLKRKKHI
jgi:hypothetical protein